MQLQILPVSYRFQDKRRFSNPSIYCPSWRLYLYQWNFVTAGWSRIRS